MIHNTYTEYSLTQQSTHRSQEMQPGRESVCAFNNSCFWFGSLGSRTSGNKESV